MNRRSPVRSVLAERRLFSNGGMLPISTPFQNTPSGILASSPPLIEAVSQEIVAPFTGGAMPMAQGGVAKFQKGGFNIGASPSTSPSNPQDYFAEAMKLADIPGSGIIDIESAEIYARLRASGLDQRAALSEIDTIFRLQSGDQRTWRTSVPPLGSVSEALISGAPPPDDLGLVTYKDKTLAQGDMRRAMELRRRALSKLRPFLGVAEMGRRVGEGIGGVFQTGPEFLVSQAGREADRLKELGFGTREELDAEILRVENLPLDHWLKQAKASDRSREFLRQNPGEIPSQVQRHFPIHEGASISIAPAPEGPPEGEQEGAPPRQDLARASTGPVVEEGVSMEQQIQELYPHIPTAALAEVLEAAELNPDATVHHLMSPGLMFPRDMIESFRTGVGESPEEVDVPVEGEHLIIDPRLKDEILRDAEAGDEKKLERDIDYYKDEFVKSMGKFEGKSDYEKGMDWIRLGMSIAGGKSQYAIKNISDGMLASMGSFTEDDRNARKFRNEIKLASAKYALGSLAKDRATLDALSKEKRSLFGTTFRVQEGENVEYNGRTYAGGDTIIAREGDIQDGTFPLDKVNPLEWDIKSMQQQVKKLEATLASNLGALKTRVGSPEKFNSTIKTYGNHVSIVRSNIQIQNLLKEAMTMTGDVTGGVNALKAFGQKVENFLEVDLGPFSSEKPEEYRFLVNQAIQKNITALLNEGNRTISDADRRRAEIIGGLYADFIMAPSVMNRRILQNTLIEFNNSIERSTQENLADMGALENNWAGSLTPGMRDRADILEQRRGTLQLSSFRPETRPEKRTIKWTEVFDVQGEGADRTLIYKPDWLGGRPTAPAAKENVVAPYKESFMEAYRRRKAKEDRDQQRRERRGG